MSFIKRAIQYMRGDAAEAQSSDQATPEPETTTPAEPPKEPETPKYVFDPAQREQMLRSAESDVHFNGWDRPDRVWGVRNDDGEEYLHLVIGEIPGDPGDVLRTIVQQAGPISSTIKAVVLSCEAYRFPDDVYEYISTLTGEQMEEYALQIGTPRDHPRRVEVRDLILVDRANNILLLERVRDTDEVKVIQGSEWIDPDLIETLRGVLGIAGWQLAMTAAMQVAKDLKDDPQVRELVQQAIAEARKQRDA